MSFPHQMLFLPAKPVLLGVSTQTSTGTPITLTLPNYEAGVLNIAFIARHAGGTAAPGLPTGWTSLVNSTTDPDYRVCYIFSDGSIGPTTTSSATSATSMSAVVASFDGVMTSRPPEHGGAANATSTTPNPSGMVGTAYGLNVMVLAYAMWNGNGSLTGIPASCTKSWTIRQGTVGGIALALVQAGGLRSMDSGTFTISASLVNRAGHTMVFS